MSLLCDNCKNERCNDRWKCHIISCPSYTEKPKQTNADRIRAMDDETLATQLVQAVKVTFEALANAEMPDDLANEICVQILEKLKQPAEGE